MKLNYGLTNSQSNAIEGRAHCSVGGETSNPYNDGRLMHQTRRANITEGRIISQVWALNYRVLQQTISKIEDWTTIRSHREAQVLDRVSL